MHRSRCLIRIVGRRKAAVHSNGIHAAKRQFHSSWSQADGSGSGTSSPHSTAFWVAAGTCVFLQIFDSADGRTTALEGQRRDDDPKDSSSAPWYRRYPTFSLERMRSSVSSSTSSELNEKNIEGSKESASTTTPRNKNTFYGQCLQRQMREPAVPYPAWDYDWDGKMTESSTLEVLNTTEGLQQSSYTGKTRHILLVRHGQYEEGPLDDRKRCLTALGRKQAHLTGKRMASLVEQLGADNINAIYTSDMLRAKQTAWIMAKSIPDSIQIKSPDSDLNEGLPAPMIPPRPDLPGVVEEVDEQHTRMERAFCKYFYRADPPKQPPSEPEYTISTSGTISMQQRPARAKPPPKLSPPSHEFDVIVCHGNIIRYFVCRALQLPPEAWLRLSVFNCSITYIMIKPNGYVSCRMIGDIGHLGYKETTFSGAHGLLWS